MKYKKLYGKEEFELIPYVKNYLENNENIEIVLYRRWKADREFTRSVRLLNEVWYAIETAEFLKEAGIPKPKWIDIDLNPDPRFKSNEVFRQAVGLVEGMGYEVRYKTLGPIATYAADHLVKV